MATRVCGASDAQCIPNNLEIANKFECVSFLF